MVRIALSLYLMLSAAAGPWLCCCTTQHLVALFTQPKTQADCGGCCGHRHHAPGHPDHRTSEPSPRKQEQPGGPSCPCKQDGSQLPALNSLDAEVAKQFHPRSSSAGSLELTPDIPVALCPSPEGAPRMHGKGHVLPFLTAQDILCALHILRC